MLQNSLQKMKFIFVLSKLIEEMVANMKIPTHDVLEIKLKSKI